MTQHRNAVERTDEKGIAASPGRIKRLFWVSIVGILLYIILDVVVQSLPPHYSPISQAESDLAVGPYGYLMAVNFVNRGVLSGVFVYALTRTFRATGEVETAYSNGKFVTGTRLLWVWAVGSFLLAFFPTDVPATPVSWHGALHLLFAFLAFIGGAFGTALLSTQFRLNRALRGISGALMAIGVLAVIFFLILVPTLSSSIGGLTERLFLGSVLLWIAVVSGYLVRQE